ncbi:MAG: IS256 family transposase [Candidatus Amoebophilus sp. 36-38]|nr:MAG: IS256 family transposase [Candidatus Amoebophilus sp. 36-38]
MTQAIEQNNNWQAVKEAAITRLKESGELSGKNGAMVPLIKEILEAAIEAELSEHLKESKPNRRNGKTSKQVKSEHGLIDFETSRDREASFEPQLIKKRQTILGNVLQDKILSLWALGMSYTDIRGHIEELYGMEISEATLSNITDSIVPKVKEWQNRPLEAVYPLVWLDAIHFKVKEEGRIVSKAVYCVLAVNQQGNKDLLGMYVGDSESSSFWLNVLTELQNRGIGDILIACIDNLTGFKEAIEVAFPKTEIQQCVIHQVRNSMKYISYKDSKEFLAELKLIYQAGTKDMAENYLLALSQKWESKYPLVIKSWTKNWNELSAYFKYPQAIRKVIYTTNMIESFHSQLRKVTKTKRVFTRDMALLKLLYLVQKDVTKKWTMPIHDWN